MSTNMLRCVAVWLMAGSLMTSALQADVMLNVVVLLDDSGSMADNMGARPRIRKINAAKQALSSVLDQLPDDARVGVYALNSQGAGNNGHWIIPLQPLDRAQTRQAIDRIQAQGGTPLGAAMKQATDALLAAREQQFYGDYRLLIVTDGEAQDEDLVDQYLPDIMSRQVTVDVIGVAMEQNHSLATRVDRYRRADDPSSLQVAIKESLAETQLNPQDPDEASAFELLEGFPVEAAEAAIQALANTDNRPIGETRDIAADDLALHQVPLPTPQDTPTGDNHQRRDGSTVSKVLVFGVLLLMMIVVKSLIRVRRMQGNRRR